MKQRSTRRHLLVWPVALALTVSLSGCGLLSIFSSDKPKPKEVAMKPPPGAQLNVTVAASPLINPDLNGRPSPLVLRLYQLAAPEAFEQADFAQLYENDQKTLGKAMLGRYEMIVQPGTAQAITTKAVPDAAFVGVVAGFRDFGDATWRAIVPFQGKKRTALEIEVTRLALKAKPQE
jgi:type VI secretion system protein VasD